MKAPRLPHPFHQGVTGVLALLMALPMNLPLTAFADPGVIGIEVNNGNPSRSVVTNLSVSLPTNAALVPNGLTLQHLSSRQLVSPTNFLLSVDALSNRVSWTFPGLPGATLADGNYLASVATTPDTNAAGPRQSASFPLHRYFGDNDGDRDVDFFDTWFFRETWGEDATSVRFDPRFDDDGDGLVTTNDLAHFNSNYFTVLPPQPGIFAHLVYDDGENPADGIVTNLAIAGSVVLTNATTRLQASLAASSSSPTTFLDVTADLAPNLTFRFDSNRLAQIHGSALTNGSYDLQLRLVESNDIISAACTLPFALGETTCSFPDLSGWTVNIATNLPPGGVAGSVTVDRCEAVLTEGDSFTVTFEKTLIINHQPSTITISFALPTFDGTATNSMRDAFEVALVDETGRPLTYTIAGANAVVPASVANPPALPPNPDACFNYTDGEVPVAAPGATITDHGSRITLHIALSPLAPNTPARLLLRLVNNDRDRATTVRIVDWALQPSDGTARLGGTGSPAFSSIAPQTPTIWVATPTTKPVPPPVSAVSSAARSPGLASPMTASTDTDYTFPIATNITVNSNYVVEIFATLAGPAALAYPPAGSVYGDNLYASTDPYPLRCGVPDSLVYRIAPNGVTKRFATIPPYSSPRFMAFPPLGSAYGDGLYLSANDLDNDPCWGSGGTIIRIQPDGNWTAVTSRGGIREPNGITFSSGTAFGDQMFCGNSIAGPAEICTVGLDGAVSGFYDRDYYIDVLHAGIGPWKDLLLFNAGAFNIIGLAPDGGITNIFLGGNARGVRSFVISTNRSFGTAFYFTTATSGNTMGIVKLMPDDQQEMLADGFPGLLWRPDDWGQISKGSLAFSPNGSVLFVAHWESGKIYRIRPKMIPADLTLSLNTIPPTARAGSTVAISGQASYTGGEAGRGQIVLVTVNGVPAEALDAAGNFFSTIHIRPGQNEFTIVAEDSLGATVFAEASLTGQAPDAATDLSQLTIVSASIQAEYGRTTFNEKTGTLYADLALRNVGTYAIKAPFYVGITRISNPTVELLAADGVTSDGIPYYDFTATLANSTLPRPLAFSNPNHVQFTYDLVVLGQLNQAPYFTTAPALEAIVGKPYTYTFNATDPDSDHLTYELLASPSGTDLNVKGTTLDLQPSTVQIGTHDITLQASDGRGGLAQQHYLLNIISPPSNRPPYFVSRPVTVARASTNVESNGEQLDLRDWTVMQHPLTFGDYGSSVSPADWRLAADGLSVTQWVNADATMLVSPAGFASERTEGSWRAADTGAAGFVDNDYMGFVFGLQDERHFYLFDWAKEFDPYDPYPPHEAGMSVKVVEAGSALTIADLWPTYSTNGQVRTLYHNTIPWRNFTNYTFALEFRPGNISITVSEVTNTLASISLSDSTYASGRFGFYNYSQGQVEYSGFTRRRLPDLNYAYDTDATDPDGDTLTYSLTVAPTNMIINPVSGLIRWGPGTNDLGQHHVTVQVEDGRGGTNWQSYIVCALPGDQPAVIVHQPCDLTVSAVDASSVSTDGRSLLARGTVSARILNKGPAPTSRPFEVLFFEDRNLNGAFDPAADVKLGQTTITESLAPGQALVLSNSVAGPVLFPGNLIWAFVDSGREIEETNETNNLANSGMDCLTQPVVGQFNPVIEWYKGSFSVSPEFDQVMMTPAVADLDGNGIPDIVFCTFYGNQYTGSGRLRAITGDGGTELWTITDWGIHPGSQVAIGDIDGDGKPEIIAIHINNAVIAFEHDGTFKWIGELMPRNVLYGAPALADLDGDGKPEVIVGSYTFDATGRLLWDGIAKGGTGSSGYAAVADLDLDGSPEVVAGNTAYRADGSVMWTNSVPDGFVAIGNFDADPYPEIVVVGEGSVSLLENDGRIEWGPARLPDTHPTLGGPPTIADMDGDGWPEIGVAGADFYVALDRYGNLLWRQPVQDWSSAATGSSVFDFEGDGRAEVVYGDETNVVIYAGASGAPLYRFAARGSGTLEEYPLVVDVDADGNAEIVVAANNYVYGDMRGIVVIGDANDTWVGTRKIWNQHTYHINNVNDDGTIPRHEEASWLAHNTYRLNLQPGQNPLAAPDLVAAYVRAAETNGEVTLTVRIGNGGAVLAPAELFVACYVGDPRSGGAFLGRAVTTARIVPGAFEDVSIALTNPVAADLWIVADDDGAGKGKVNECQEANNFYRPGLALPLVNHTPVITSVPAVTGAEGQLYRYALTAADPDAGDTLTFSLAAAPAGAAIDVASGLISWTPGASQSGYHLIRAVVADNRGAQAWQDFTVQVTEQVNTSPVFVSAPPTKALPNQTLQYNSLARDADGDALTFDLLVAPPGMIVETNTETVAWRPLFGQLGSHDVILRAQDGRGGVAMQSWAIKVDPPNAAPFITTVPPGPAAVDLPYRYIIRAQDPEGQPLAFSLATNAPAGTTLDSQLSTLNSAVLSWTPALTNVGLNPIEIIVRDTAGGEARQAFTLEVVVSAPNRPPQFVSAPRTQTRIATPWYYEADATDPDGDPLTFELVSGPNGMVLTNSPLSTLHSPLLLWTPDTVGSFPVTLSVKDGRPGGAVTQQFTITVSSTLHNSAPVIVSTPPFAGTAGQPYEYNLVAQDPDNDPITWRLVGGPIGMSLDSASGKLRWVPSLDQLGTNTVAVEVADTFQATAAQTWQITVGCVNQSPQITSVPPVVAEADQLYLYALRANDPDGDPLTFTLLDPVPAGITITNSQLPTPNSQLTSGALIRWLPTTNEAGPHLVQVRASDGRGGTDTQVYTLYVTDTRANHPPVILSSPFRGAGTGRPYRYVFQASDPDGDPLTIQSLLPLPAGATFKPQPSTINTAVLEWTPTEDQLGPHDFILVAKDPSLASAAQRFTLTVRANQAPVITSAPLTSAIPNVTYRYDVVAYDLEGDPLTYTLASLVPPGLTMDNLGRIAWTPTTAQLGTREITVTVTDTFGASASQTFPITVAADAEPPVVALDLITGNLAWLGEEVALLVGTTIRFRVRAADNVGVVGRALTIGTAPLPLSNDGETVQTFASPLLSEVRAFAWDSAGNTNYTARTLRIYDPNATSGLSVVIHSPAYDAVVTRPVDIVATITNATDIGRYKVDFAPVGDVDLGNIGGEGHQWTTLADVALAEGVTEINQAVLVRFDPTMLLNDAYVIRVYAQERTSGLGWYEPVVVNVQGNLKFGEFRLEFTDLQVPVAGMPITISRVYDSRQSRRIGDFGYGWSLGVQSARIQATLKDGTLYVGSRVFINTPDGRRVGFSAYPEIVSAFGPFILANIRLRPDPGVFEQLEIVGNQQWVTRSGLFLGGLLDENVNPSSYRLTTKDGTVYEYDRDRGLERVTDANANRLVFTRNGIFHYSAGSATPDQQVPFIRDAQGRITRIMDPAGKAIAYAYDAAGDLYAFTDQAANLTQYAYAYAPAHFLTNIVDPLGHQTLRMEYDASGRLTTIRDALGNPIEQNFDLDASTATFKDANGHTNIVRYDDNGNETMKAVPGIYTNYFQFDANNNEVWRQDGRGFVTTRAYDTRGNLTSIVDALSNVTAIAYNDLNKPTSVTDALGRSTEFRYNERGDLTNVVNALGGQAFFTRDSQGRVTSVTDFNGHTTTYDYAGGCSCGKPGKVINPDGTFRLYDYNALGQTTREVNELGHETLSSYDDAGRLLWVRDAETNYTRYLYRAGLKIAEIDPLNRTNWFGYDDANRLTSRTNAMGGVVRFEYDSGTNRTAVIDPVGNVTRFHYDAANRLSHQVDPWGRTNFFAYDAAGNRTETVDRNGRKRTFGYDALNRRTNELWCEGTNFVRTIDFTFNALGIMTAAADPASRLEFDFDALNRLERATQSGVAGLPDFTLTCGYDGMNNVVSVADNWGVQVVSAYNARNQLTQRVWQGGGLPAASLRFDYDAAGNRTNILRYADTSGTVLAGQSRYGFSPVGLITDILHTSGAAATQAEYHYKRNAAHEITQRVLGGQTADYRYDLTGQLTNSLYSAGQANEGYHYDANGNRVGGSYVVATNNQIVADGTNTYSYDLEGSMVGRSNTLTHATSAYCYDHRNRLLGVVDTDAGGTVTQTVEFTYDALNRRIAKSVNGAVTRFLLNQENIWADANGSAAITTRYLLGNQIDEMLARYRPGDTVVWYLTDNLGTLRDLADLMGTVVNHVNYDSFGRVLAQLAPAVGDRFTFTGREWDAETGLLFYRARYYSPSVGTFLSEDPVGLSESECNLYRYVGNNPISNSDPTGNGLVGYSAALRGVTYEAMSAGAHAGALARIGVTTAVRLIQAAIAEAVQIIATTPATAYAHTFYLTWVRTWISFFLASLGSPQLRAEAIAILRNFITGISNSSVASEILGGL